MSKVPKPGLGRIPPCLQGTFYLDICKYQPTPYHLYLYSTNKKVLKMFTQVCIEYPLQRTMLTNEFGDKIWKEWDRRPPESSLAEKRNGLVNKIIFEYLNTRTSHA